MCSKHREEARAARHKKSRGIFKIREATRCQVPGLMELPLRRDFDFYPEIEDFQRMDVYGLITFREWLAVMRD